MEKVFSTTIIYVARQVIGILNPFNSVNLGWGETDY